MLLGQFVLPRLFAQRAHRELAWARHPVNDACVTCTPRISGHEDRSSRLDLLAHVPSVLVELKFESVARHDFAEGGVSSIVLCSACTRTYLNVQCFGPQVGGIRAWQCCVYHTVFEPYDHNNCLCLQEKKRLHYIRELAMAHAVAYVSKCFSGASTVGSVGCICTWRVSRLWTHERKTVSTSTASVDGSTETDLSFVCEVRGVS